MLPALETSCTHADRRTLQVVRRCSSCLAKSAYWSLYCPAALPLAGVHLLLCDLAVIAHRNDSAPDAVENRWQNGMGWCRPARDLWMVIVTVCWSTESGSMWQDQMVSSDRKPESAIKEGDSPWRAPSLSTSGQVCHQRTSALSSSLPAIRHSVCGGIRPVDMSGNSRAVAFCISPMKWSPLAAVVVFLCGGAVVG